MTLLYPEEHILCENHDSSNDIRFQYHELTKGEKLTVGGNEDNHLFFLLKGSAIISSYKTPTQRILQKNNMLFLPKMTDLEIEAATDLTFVTHSFKKLISLCDKVMLQSLASLSKETDSSFQILDMRPPFDKFFSLLTFYLQKGMLCNHMYEIKHKEIFLLFRAFYTKAENAAFFAAIIGEKMAFKSLVMENYLKVKSINELAKLCNQSVSSFIRLFKENFNDTPNNWIQVQKAKRIAAALLDQDVFFNQIIDDFGFSSPSHFTKFCKHYLKMTPSEYREKAIQKYKKKGIQRENERKNE